MSTFFTPPMYPFKSSNTPMIRGRRGTVASPVLARHLYLGSPDNKDRKLGYFEFVLALVIITTVGKVAERRMSRGRRDDMADLSGRLERLEEGRDFYKDLLEPEAARHELPPSESHD